MTATLVVVETTAVGAESEVADEVTETQEARGAAAADSIGVITQNNGRGSVVSPTNSSRRR